MRILCVCDQGNNRSVHFAHQLRYWGNDVLSAGLETNNNETLVMLCAWAEMIICTSMDQVERIPNTFRDRTMVLDVGPDTYPRPFNPELLRKVNAHLQEHKATLRNIKPPF